MIGRVPHHRALWSVRLMAVISLVATSVVSGIPPPFISDDELSQMPVIVVGHWEKASAFTSRKNVIGNQLIAGEGHTTIVIERVIRGKIRAGTHELLTSLCVGWRNTGGPVMSYTSTEMVGDATDITLPNLWFLEWTRSWDKSDKKKYLSLTTYRGVQPLELEPYFVALLAFDPGAAVVELLTPSVVPSVGLRGLEYIHGGTPPWPYWTESDEWHRGKPDTSKRLHQYVYDVEPLMDHPNAEVRRFATAVFGSLRGKGAVERLREKLMDSDGGVRAITIGLLASHRDVNSIADICRAAHDIHDGFLGCTAIDRMKEWGDMGLVRALIAFLREGEFAFRHGNDIGIPALRAQAALKAITGFTFPFDPARSLRAWSQTRAIPSNSVRLARLAELLPDDPRPLQARAVGTPEDFYVEIKNRSKHVLSITTQPSTIEAEYPAGIHSRHSRAQSAKDFVILDPATAIRQSVELPERFLHSDVRNRHLRLWYWNNGRQFGVNAWIGHINVEFADGWTEPRVVLEVAEYWPNGNWKAKGKTLNGKRIDFWEFYNEAGDIIESADYSYGGSATHNPNHPANRGKGIPKKK